MDILKVNSSSYFMERTGHGDADVLLEKRIILEDNTPVFQFIDNLGIDSNSIYKIRAAREIVFNFDAYLKQKSTNTILFKPKRLSELINYIDEMSLDNYRLVLDTENKDILSEIIQQLFYLEIDMEVMLLNEEADRKRMALFVRGFSNMKRALERIEELIFLKEVKKVYTDDKENILNALLDIEGLLTDIKGRDLKVSIMALKKSGKSVLVNCFLGEEYAPSSIELPTFNTCIYRRSKDGKISLNYKDRHIYFESASDVKKYVLDEFKRAQSSHKSSYTIDDMEISYVTSPDSLCNYTIIDTPGPDLAGSDHKKIAYKWIGVSDVVLFIVDYTKHLTVSEEKFFRHIKSVFEDQNKFYSFIVVVNKLDLMYLSEEKKSALRFIDFLRSKLKALGYKGFIVHGISALQYFYSMKSPQINGCEGLLTDDCVEMRECLDDCLKLYQGKEDMTILSFIDSQLRNLLWFHAEEDITLKRIKEKSGVEQLIKYINYIAIEKASIEIFNHKLSLIDRNIEKIRNNFILLQIRKLKKSMDTLDGNIKDLTEFFEGIKSSITGEGNLSDITGRIKNDINIADKTLGRILNMHIGDVLKSLERVLQSLSSDELILLQKGEVPNGMDKISYTIREWVLEKNYNQVLAKYRNDINKSLEGIERKLTAQNKTIQDNITEFSKHMKGSFKLDASNVALPKLPDSFNSPDFSPIVLKLDTSYASSLFKERLARKRGLTGTVLMILSLGRVKIKTGNYKLDDVKLKKALFLVRKNIEDKIQHQIVEQNEKLFLHINTHLNALNEGISEKIGNIIADYESVFTAMIREMESSREDVESRMEFLKEVGEEIEGFSLLWKQFREESDSLP